MSTQVIKPKVKTDEFTSVLGVLVVLGSITMLFVALFVSYSILRIQFGMWSKPGTLFLIPMSNPTIVLLGGSDLLLHTAALYNRSNCYSLK